MGTKPSIRQTDAVGEAELIWGKMTVVLLAVSGIYSGSLVKCVREREKRVEPGVLFILPNGKNSPCLEQILP